MDIIRTVLVLKKIDCFIATETWFTDHHADSLVSVPDYCCFRDDRLNRIGGGVAIWSKVDLCPESIVISEKPDGIELVALKMNNCKMLIIGCCIPPQIVTSSHDLVSRFLIDTVDSFLNEYPTFDVMLCGDFNRLKVENICSNCNLSNVHNQATYGDAELDYVLISESAASFYSVFKVDPIDVSTVPHASLLAIPAVVRQNQLHLSRPFYDLRASNIDHFVNQLA